jgi:hypothetical protein
MSLMICFVASHSSFFGIVGICAMIFGLFLDTEMLLINLFPASLATSARHSGCLQPPKSLKGITDGPSLKAVHFIPKTEFRRLRTVWTME